MQEQRTIAETVSCRGVGLHCGLPVQLTLRAGPADSGVVFLRQQDGATHRVPARADAVCSTANATTIAQGDAAVATVEHLLATLHAFGVDNVLCELDGPELPALDGSAIGFVELVRSAGRLRQSAPRRRLRVLERLEVVDGARRISIEPARGLSLSCTIDFAHPAIGRQTLEIGRLGPRVFEREIARARTFGFLAEVEALRRAGLARGGSLENTVVLDGQSVLNPDGLRWPDEFVRHKLLDLIGDLALLGLPLDGHVRVERGGHALHHQLLRALLGRPSAWRVTGSPAAPREAEGPRALLAGRTQRS